ncbi:hypothetical protein L7F22_021544 [Adiantum nelumboides]|nr:hypothetical protein [Adiantum nelumboides]
MVDVHSNGGSKRSPVLDLNQALTKDEEEEEERQKETLGPSWLFGKPQNPWLQSNDQDLSDRKNRTLEENPALEQHQGVSGRPYTHPAEQLGFRETSISLHNEQHDHDMETEQRFQVIDIWKNNSDPTMDLTKSFPAMEDVKRIQDKRTVSLGTMWEREQAALHRIQRSLSPVSPPLTKKSLSPVSPEQRPPEEIRGAALRRERSPAKRGSSYRSPVRGHNSGGDAYSKRRRDRDNSLSPRTLSKKRRDRSPSPSPVVRSTRIRRSRTRSPVSRGHRYSPPRSRHSPRARYSPRRRSPVSYRPKRRPWSPPPNRNTGLGKPGRNLFIAGFSFGTTERDLERKFSRYGRVRDVRIVRDKRCASAVTQTEYRVQLKCCLGRKLKSEPEQACSFQDFYPAELSSIIDAAGQELVTEPLRQLVAELENLEHQLAAEKLADGEKVEAFIKRMKDLIDQLAAVGVAISPEDLARRCIRILPVKYDALVIALITQVRPTELTFEELSAMLLEEELRLRTRAGGADAAFTANTKGKGSSSKSKKKKFSGDADSKVFGILATPLLSQQVGSQNRCQNLLGLKHRRCIRHRANSMETPVRLSESMQTPKPMPIVKEQVAETPVSQAMPVQPATFQQPNVGSNGQGSSLHAMQQIFPPPSVHPGYCGGGSVFQSMAGHAPGIQFYTLGAVFGGAQAMMPNLMYGSINMQPGFQKYSGPIWDAPG